MFTKIALCSLFEGVCWESHCNYKLYFKCIFNKHQSNKFINFLTVKYINKSTIFDRFRNFDGCSIFI